MKKESIAIYWPTDPFERVIQESYHECTDRWLTSYRCQLIADALASLKIYDDWLDAEDLLAHRIKYFFSENMSSTDGTMCFPTQFVFLRDILENNEIDGHLHKPVVFLSPKLVHFLFREYPVLIEINTKKLRSENDDVLFIEEGGLLISDGQNVSLEKCITRVKTQRNNDLNHLVSDQELKSLLLDSGFGMQKAAASLTKDQPGVFKIDRDERNLRATMPVQRKSDKKNGRIIAVEPGEAGIITVRYDGDDEERTVMKSEFDKHFVVTASSEEGKRSTYPITVGGKSVEMNERQIENLIKNILKKSKTFHMLCRRFKVSPDRVDGLRIIVRNLIKKYAETDENVMKLNRKLFEHGNFLQSYFFVIMHEIVHWLTRMKEDEAYFNDPEEVLGFVASIAYEMEGGSNDREIWDKVFPKISWHFDSEHDAREFFRKSIRKARELIG